MIEINPYNNISDLPQDVQDRVKSSGMTKRVKEELGCAVADVRHRLISLTQEI